MKILIDTNILISAALFPNGVAAKAYSKAVTYPSKGVICDWSIDELNRVFNRKFPDRIPLLNQFLAMISTSVEIIPTPIDEVLDELKIRDIKDRPILRSAQSAGIDLLLTGDKDFLESGVKRPLIVSPSFFLASFDFLEHLVLQVIG